MVTHPATSPTYKRTRLDPRDREYCGNFGFNPTIRWAWSETFAVAKALDAKVVLFQCPPSFRPTKENVANLRRFFERAKRGKFHMAWEPRGEWAGDLIASLCKELELVPVMDPLKTKPISVSKIRYFRLHGTTGSHHRFGDDELQQLKKLCSDGVQTYCLFNNVGMIRDAERFMKLFG